MMMMIMYVLEEESKTCMCINVHIHALSSPFSTSYSISLMLFTSMCPSFIPNAVALFGLPLVISFFTPLTPLELISSTVLYISLVVEVYSLKL